MADKQYIELLRKPIQDLRGRQSGRVGAVPLRGLFRGQTVFDGGVDVFRLAGYARARGASARPYPTGESNENERIVVVLQIPPLAGSASAVQAAIVSRSTNQSKR